MITLFSFFNQKLKGIPWGIILVTYLIIAVGLYNLYSATTAAVMPGKFYDQMTFVLLGTLGLIILGVVADFKDIERLTVVAYVVVCILLFCVDIFGKNAKGAERWLVMGPIRLQPSEFAKFVVILIVAKSFQARREMGEYTIFKLWRQILFVSVPFLLIAGQPDLTTASMILLIAGIQIATVKIKLRILVSVVALSTTFSIIAWFFFLYDYQKQRILTFLNPMLDPRGSGYHAIQSMIAVGNGGLLGQGFGQGSQSRLNFLPERHTDFAFSVWAEEHGFMGCLLVVILFVILITQLFQVSQRARDSFSAMVAVGVSAFFMFHFLINISMVLGIFPVAGVPLTFISYGGTHMITALCCIGLIVGLERKRYMASPSGQQ